jgi:hypothetical protein
LFTDARIKVINRFVSLTPGFSRVGEAARKTSRFNGLPAAEKPLKRFSPFPPVGTGLKPGVNENALPMLAKINRIQATAGAK